MNGNGDVKYALKHFLKDDIWNVIVQRLVVNTDCLKRGNKNNKNYTYGLINNNSRIEDQNYVSFFLISLYMNDFITTEIKYIVVI